MSLKFSSLKIFFESNYFSIILKGNGQNTEENNTALTIGPSQTCDILSLKRISFSMRGKFAGGFTYATRMISQNQFRPTFSH